MRLLLFLILVALGLWVILPPWIMVYVRSQLWYLFSFQWLHEVKYVLRFWEWIPAQCGWDNGGGLLLVIHWALGMVWLFGHYGYTDAFLRITIGICATHCFFYAGDVVTEYVFCSSKRFMDGNHCTSVIIEGLNSVSILNWYIDSVVIQPVSVIFIFIEGWRVRMGFFKVMAYAIFAATFTQIVSLPLFLLEWRNHVRVLDVAWKLQSKTKDSWINNHARKDAAMMYSQQHTSNLRVSAAQAQSTGPSTDSPASATSSAAIVPTPVKSTITPSHHRTRSGRFPSWLSVPPNVPSFAINSPPSPTPTPTQAPLSAISSSDELPPLSPMMNNSADEFSSNILRRRHSRRSMGKKSLEFKKSQLARINTQLDGSLTDSCLGVPSSAPPVMRQRRQSESMFGGGLRRIGKRLLGPSAVEEDDDDDDSQYNSKKHHTSEIDDKIDMATLTKQFWAYGEERGTEGVPASDMINDPSPVPFRYWPTILGGKHSGIDLCIVVPILFILAGGIEFWTWWTWMDVYVRSHCWLAGFLEFAFISPSSFMMITGGWHGFFIWSTFMYCTEPAKNRKYVIYLFMQITFHNVAFGMVTYILWREFRLRYLPSSSSPDGEVSLMQGSDRSVWYSSYSPDRYFLKPKDCEPRKYIQQEVEELGKKIYYRGVAVVEWIRLPVSTVLQLTGLADLFRWLCAKVAHTFPPFAMMAHDLHRIMKETIWLNWLDIMVFIRSIIQSFKRVFSSHAPLPTPSTRRTIIDWTLFVPYVLTTWVLCLNAYVLCWCLGQNTAARLVSTWFICVVNFLYFTARSQSQVRSQWAWLSFEIDSEFTQRVSKDQSELQTIYAATGLNLLTASLSPAMSPLSPETPITPAPHMHAHAHAHSTHMSTFSPPMMHNSTLSAPIAFSHLNASSTVNTPAMTPSPAPSESPSFISISATPTPRSGIGISNFGHAAATTRMRRRKITDLDYYRPFVWNPHVLWTFTYLGLTFLGAFILLPDMQFDLPWWSHLYADFRQNGIDGIHRGTGAGMNMPLLVISLALGFPLFFGFTIQSPKMSLGLPHMSSVMKLLFILPLVLIYGVVWDHAIEPCYTPLGMEGPPLAPEYLRQVNETITATVRQRVQPPTNNPFLTTNTALRPVHPKTHGCLEAEFTTPFFIPAKFRAGIFAVPPLPSGEVRSWKAFVRFSNGGLQKRARDGSWNVQPDSLPDVRGMSVKLLNVEGKKALDPEFLAKYPEQKTQDFVTISSPFFFAASGEGYVQDFMFFAKPSLSAFVKWFFPNELFNLSEWQKMWSKIRTLWALKQMNDDGANVYNPLDINYFSAAPFRLGDDMEKSTAQGRAAMAVKYRWKPCHIANRPGEGESPIDRVSLALRSGYRRVRNSVAALRGAPQTTARDEHLTIAEAERLTAEENPINFLRMNLQHRLDKNANHSIYTPMPFSRVKPEDDVCFILMVQDQMEPCRNKIEDCMKPWDGPWTRVGKLTIPKQNFLSSQQLEFCNNLSFNPWHALEAHRPLGQINQLRKIAYLAASEERRRLNGVNDTSVFIADYKGDELTKLGQSDHALSGEPASYSFAEYNKPYDRMPKRVAVVPYTELMSNETHIEIVKRLLMAGRSIAYPQQKLRAELTTPQDYEYFMLGRPDEAVFNNSNMAVSGRMRRPEHVAGHVWTSDSWWASQFIRGLNPMMIQLASSSNPLPWDALGGRFTPDLESQVANVLAKEKVKTLDGLIRQKRIFFIDYEEFEDISTYGDRVLYAPIIVFYLPALPNKRELMPLFIQLDRKSHIASGMRPKIFFPAPISEYYPDHMTNEGLVWLFAKMHASAADAVAHQMIYHLCETHLVLEPTIIATHRAFRADHPIMKLLSQHFTGTIAINEFGRETLLSDMHSQLDDFLSPGLQGSLQLMQKHYRGKHYRYMETVPDQIRRRGFNVERPRDAANWGTNEDELPGFVYRDYAIAIYHKFRHYVETVLKKTKYGYEPKKQQEVFDNDIQVKAWLHQLGSPTAADIPNMPPVTNFDQLVDFVTQIMFQGSAQHAAVNFAQYEYQAFQPARPLFLTRGMPVNTSIVDHSFILRSMMPMDEMVLAVGLFDILSACCVNTLMLDLSEADGYTNAKTTITPAYPDEWDELKRELRVIENEMKRYNGEKGYLYPYLYPSRIPMSAAI